jgi:hypothetical protein
MLYYSQKKPVREKYSPGMAALTGVMVIEKAIPGGKRLSPFIGVMLLLLGVLWLAHPIWLQRAGI